MSAGNLQSARLIRYELEAEHAMLAVVLEIVLPQRRRNFYFFSTKDAMSSVPLLKSEGC